MGLKRVGKRIMEQTTLAYKLVAYMQSRGYAIARDPYTINIIYLEGSDFDGTPNPDRPDEWNDRRIVLVFDKAGTPTIVHNCQATTEPGLSATMSVSARKRGGCARIAIGQHTAWRLGWHKKPEHTALVQVMPLPVHRDYNRDSKRTGDRVDVGLFGINQHGTRPNIRPTQVGTWSEGCLVARYWTDHLRFIEWCQMDARYVADPLFIFSATVIDGDDFGRFSFTL